MNTRYSSSTVAPLVVLAGPVRERLGRGLGRGESIPAPDQLPARNVVPHVHASALHGEAHLPIAALRGHTCPAQP